MLFQTLSISSIILGLYLIFAFFEKNEINVPFDYEADYHMGCYNSERDNTHSKDLSSFLENIEYTNSKYSIQPINSSISYKIDFNKEAKQVARNFEKFLNEHYKVKSKTDFQYSYNNSLRIAKNQAQNCKYQIQALTEEQCLKNWGLFTESKQEYEGAKQELVQKIRAKQSKEDKISSLFFNNDFQDQDELQKVYKTKISALDTKKQASQDQLQNLRTSKIQISSKLTVNSDTLKELTSKLNDCQKNKKVITFCNELVEDLKVISLNVTKQDLQKRIYRKMRIIQAYQNAIKKAKKYNDHETAQYNQIQLQKNKEELELLELRISGLQLSQQKYCTQCSQQKVKILRQDIQNLQNLVSQQSMKIQSISLKITQLQQEIQSLKKQRDALEEELQFSINSKVCISQQCKQQRQKNITQYKNQLNELKIEVLGQKDKLNSHFKAHMLKIKNLQEYISKLSQLNECARKKQYYDKLTVFAPKHDKNQMMHIGVIKNKILEELSHFNVDKKAQIQEVTQIKIEEL